MDEAFCPQHPGLIGQTEECVYPPSRLSQGREEDEGGRGPEEAMRIRSPELIWEGGSRPGERALHTHRSAFSFREPDFTLNTCSTANSSAFAQLWFFVFVR